ncbi:hypothetical protein Tco_0937873 [Tanacetum coccineum]|uniref:Uncharacterized protein n=1 Tax=Tanacetum coccineum TaxID=301880 RepID=A0ABQ5DI96_9ASTR
MFDGSSRFNCQNLQLLEATSHTELSDKILKTITSDKGFSKQNQPWLSLMFFGSVRSGFERTKDGVIETDSGNLELEFDVLNDVQWSACTAEDFDTTGEVPLSNSLNIGLYSNSSSFDDVFLLSQQFEEHFLDFVDRDLNCLVQLRC